MEKPKVEICLENAENKSISEGSPDNNRIVTGLDTLSSFD